MIDIIIPTMWMSTELDKSLISYTLNPLVNKVIIIDNNVKNRPLNDILNHPKIELVSYGRNIYVNPAWNEGAKRATSDIIAIINDDIIVHDSVFELVINFNLQLNDLIGVNLRGYQDNYKIDEYINTKEEIVKINFDRRQPIGGQAWAFGICMFMRRESYHTIPSLYQIWYGDDYLAQHSTNVYALNSNKIKGKISETLSKFNDPNSDISKRIELDSKNLLAFDHFENSENWDIPKNMIKMYEQQRNVQTKSVFEIEYESAKTTPSDINENVHELYELAKECNSVIEMGVRTGVSTRAFLNSNVSLISYDIILNETVSRLFVIAKKQGKDVQYIQANVLDITIPKTDLLFIDTLHTYEQLKQELKLHSDKVNKYIAFHDTYTFGLKGEVGNDRKGLLSAIVEFLIENPNWKFYKYKTNNNGLTVLKRIYNEV